ncbi:MAG: TonB family protein [Acidobacteriota bacterium]
MGSDDRKAEEFKNEGDTYEATVLEFLDKEIAGSTNSTDDPVVQRNDVDLLVDSLLKESITVSDAMAAGQDPGLDDLDRLFSNIFGNQKEVLQGEAKDARPQLDPRCSTTLSEIDSVEKGSANLRPVENAPKQQASDMPRSKVAWLRETAPTETVQSSPQLPLVQETHPKSPNPDRVVATAETSARDQISVFSIPERRPPWNMQMLAVAIAFLCLLAATGIVYFAGSKSSAPAMIQKPGPAMPQTIHAREGTALPTQDSPNPGTEANHTHEQKAPSAASAGTPPVSNAGNSLDTAAPRRGGKPAMTDSTASPVNSSPGAAVVAPSGIIEKSAPTVVPAADSSAANPPSHTPGSASSVPSFQTQTAPASTLAQLIPKDAVDLGSLPPVSKPALQAPPMPSNATPAAVISRVLPVYPEIARKSRTTGTVVLDVLIDEQGKVVKVTPASGPLILCPEAATAVLRWRFKPATLNGVNVSSSTQVSIVFK